MKHKSLAAAALIALSTVTLRAQTTTVLEGFETFTNVSSLPGLEVASDNGASAFIWTLWGVRGSSGLVTVSIYNAKGPGDPRVTEGSNSLAVTFLAQGFGNDFAVTLSDDSTAAIETAGLSTDIARYILRYDVIFEHADQYTYFNQHSIIANGWDYVNLGGAVMKTNAGVAYAVVSFSEPLDLPTLSLPFSGALGWFSDPLTGRGGSWITTDQFNTTQAPFTNCTIYIDNIRLVDTYAPGATAVVYPLQSFENAGNPMGGATNLYPTVTNFYGNPCTSRATLSGFVINGIYDPATDGQPGIYTTNKGPADGDFAVTDGGHALQVSNRFPANINFQFDFALPFAGTKLAQVLAGNPSPAQLAHYTLRWDTTMPAVYSTSDGDFVNMVYNTGAAYLPMAQGRRQSLNQLGLQRLTYSVTLDQIAAWGGSPVGGDPTLFFAFNGPSEGIPFVYYYDNFVLIDTAPPPPSITAFQYNPVTKQFTLTWTSIPNATYSVLASATLDAGSFTTLVAGVPSGGNQTTATVTLSGGATGFLKVMQE